MAKYITPSKSNIPFSFGTGGYTPPDFGNLSINFDVTTVRGVMSDLKAAVQVFDTKQETYTYLKYCERYIVGYNSSGVQIIKGRCYYGGIRDVGGFLRSTKAAQANLGAELIGRWRGEPLYAYIAGHLPENLLACIRGFAFENLPGAIKILFTYDLPAILHDTQPINLNAYIKARLIKNFPARIRGWREADLGGYIGRRVKADLRGVIGVIKDVYTIGGVIKGWIRATHSDLGALLHAYKEEYLEAFIRGAEFRDLGGILTFTQPVPLGARIHGWQEAYLQGIIAAQQYPWDLLASIFGSGGFKDLRGQIKPIMAARVYRDLPAFLMAVRFRKELNAVVQSYAISDLNGYINSGKDRSDLGAYIAPRMIRLTAIISIITMEHKDLVGIINAACLKNLYKDLSAFIRPVFLSDLPAYIKSISVPNIKDLSAYIGWRDKYAVMDKLPLNIEVKSSGYKTEDKLKLLINMSLSASDLFGQITGTLDERNLGAYVWGVGALPYDFDYWKTKERVYELSYGIEQNYKDIDIDFETIVRDYFYSSDGDFVSKVDRDEHWRTRLRSYYSSTDMARLQRRLYKAKILFGIDKYKSIDDAMKAAIVYVTEEPKYDLSANITGTGGHSELIANIIAKRIVRTNNNLTSYINGISPISDDTIFVAKSSGVNKISTGT
jgi:hypothetical protein